MLLTLAQSLSIPRDPVLWGFVISFIAVAYVFFKARQNTRKDPLSGPPPFSSLSSQRRIENQMTELLVELEKMSRQMNAQLETRAAKLEELIRQADERAGMLEQRLDDLRREFGDPILLRQPPSSSQPAIQFRQDELPPPAPIPIDPRHAAVYRLADQGRSSSDIAREVNQPANEVELILALRRRAK